MKKLSILPGTLTGQFTLLLAIALLVANAIAFAVLNTDRNQKMRDFRRNAQIERLVTLVPALNALVPELRADVVKALSGWRMRLELGGEPLVNDVSSGMSAARLAELIEEHIELPEGEKIRMHSVERDAASPRKGWWHTGGGRRIVTQISIPLLDGSWLNARQTITQPGVPLPGRAILLTLLLSFLAVLAVGLWFIRRLTKPLKILGQAAERVGRGDRSSRIPEKGAVEFAEVARTFNAMQRDISRFDAERARTVAAVGHDLRTPITSLRLRVEMVEDDELRMRMTATLDDMKVMAEELLSWGRVEAEQEAMEDMDLSRLMHDVCDGTTVSLSDSGSIAVKVKGRPVAIRRALTNLVENTERYAGGGSAALRVKGDMAILRIEDQGPGIPESQLKQIFDPFRRGDDSRSTETGGSGLGLSIVQSIVRSHGGTISIANREDGRGLKVEVRLPIV